MSATEKATLEKLELEARALRLQNTVEFEKRIEALLAATNRDRVEAEFTAKKSRWYVKILLAAAFAGVFTLGFKAGELYNTVTTSTQGHR